MRLVIQFSHFKVSDLIRIEQMDDRIGIEFSNRLLSVIRRPKREFSFAGFVDSRSQWHLVLKLIYPLLDLQPKALGSVLHTQCNKWSSGNDEGVKFVWGKGAHAVIVSFAV